MTETHEDGSVEARVSRVIRAHFRRMGIEYHDGPDSPDDVIARDVVRELAVIAESFPGATNQIQTLANELGGWICEQHPDQSWPHDECAGPGRLPDHPYEAQQRASEATWTQDRSTSPSSPKHEPSSHDSNS